MEDGRGGSGVAQGVGGDAVLWAYGTDAALARARGREEEEKQRDGGEGKSPWQERWTLTGSERRQEFFFSFFRKKVTTPGNNCHGWYFVKIEKIVNI